MIVPVQRVIGSVLLFGLIVLILQSLLSVILNIDYSELVDHIPIIWKGFTVTVLIVFVSFFSGLIFCIPISSAVIYFPKQFSFVINFYWLIFRMTPALVQMYIVYFGAGEISDTLQAAGIWWIFKDPLPCIIFVLILNTSAKQSFLLTNALKTISKTQWESATALGLTKHVIFFKILLPQAAKIAVKPFGNEFTTLIKTSTIASLFSVKDLMGVGKEIYNETINLYYYFIFCFIFFIMVDISRLITNKIFNSYHIKYL